MFSHNKRLQSSVRCSEPGLNRSRCALAALATGQVLHPNGGITVGS